VRHDTIDAGVEKIAGTVGLDPARIIRAARIAPWPAKPSTAANAA
jgi:hypothetical protein